MKKPNPSTYLPAILLLALALCTALEHQPRASAQSAPAPAATPAPKAPDLAALQAEIERLKTLLPDQAHAMADVDYHFTNLWFAAEKQNWPLAKFYLDETKSHLNWAVRIRPLRKTAGGQDVDLKVFLQALEASSLNDLKKAVDGKDHAAFTAAYRQMLEGCYSCHVASEKPFLRLHVPEQPEARIIDFVPTE